MTLDIPHEEFWVGDIAVSQEFCCELSFRLKSSQGVANNKGVDQWQIKNAITQINYSTQPDRIEFLSTAKEDTIAVAKLCFFKEDACIKFQQIFDNKCVTIANQRIIINALKLASDRNNSYLKASWEGVFFGNQKDVDSFDTMERGNRPDTLFIRGLPLKWFDLDTKSLKTTGGIFPPSNKFKQAMNKFGTVRCMEILPVTLHKRRNSCDDSFALDMVLNCEAYVQYEEYASFCNAMVALGGGKVISNNSGLVIPLEVSFDETGYMTDTEIRQRRFAREKEIHKGKEASLRLEKEMEEKREIFHLNEKRFDQLRQEVKSIQKERLEIHCENDDIDASLKQCIQISEKKIVMDPLKDFDVLSQIMSQLEELINKVKAMLEVSRKVESERLKQKYQSKMLKFQKDSMDRISEISKDLNDCLIRFEKKVTEHVAVVAEIKAAEEAIQETRKVIDKMPQIDENISEDKLQDYAARVDDELNEAEYVVKAALSRVHAVDQIVELTNQLNVLLNGSEKREVKTDMMQKLIKENQNYLVHGIETLWSSSTLTLNKSIDNIQDRINQVQVVYQIDERVFSLKERLEKLFQNSEYEKFCNEVIKNRVEEIEQHLKHMMDENIIKDGILSFNKLEKQCEGKLEDLNHMIQSEKEDRKKKERERKEAMEKERIFKEKLQHDKVVEAYAKIDSAFQEKEREAKKRFRNWQMDIVNSQGIGSFPVFRKQKIEHFRDRYYPQFVKHYTTISYLSPCELLLKSKVDNLSTKILAKIQTDQEEEKLRRLALESKMRVQALSCVKASSPKVSSSTIPEPSNKDSVMTEEILRRIALETMAKTKSCQ